VNGVGRNGREPAPGERLATVGRLLDESSSLSSSAGSRLEGVGAQIAAIGERPAGGENLDRVATLVKNSKKFSEQAKANARGVAENAEAISREAEARQQLKTQS
jgi:hypothetical protein